MSAFSIRNGSSVVSGDFSKLEKLVGALKSKHFVDIGIFKTAKTRDGMHVAEYGAYNEFGSISRKDHPPARSFIRMPLTSKQSDIQKDVEKNAPDHLAKGDVKAIFEDLGFSGESQIQKAFDTRGFGQWRENAPATIAKKGSDAPLIDIGLLRNSVTHRVG